MLRNLCGHERFRFETRRPLCAFPVLLLHALIGILGNRTTQGSYMTTFKYIAGGLLLFGGSIFGASHAQEPAHTFLPDGLLFTPLIANHQEPRVGLRKEAASSRMKLDIGNSLDIVEFVLDTGNTRLRFGVDFFTYAFTTSSEGFRLQVDAVDGFFGGHVVLRRDMEKASLRLRLRLLHLSAHFLDGHYGEGTGWKDGRGPIPFTRDFGEMVGGIHFEAGPWKTSVYGGFSYATLIRPVEIRRFQFLGSLEVYNPEVIGPVFGKPCNVFAAYALTMVGLPAYQGQNNVEAGVKFGTMEGSGIRLFGGYFSGPDVFSQYYDLRRSHWGLGFAFDFY